MTDISITRNPDALERWALERPNEVAYRLLPSEISVTWSELERRSRACASLLAARGLKEGDGIAIFLDNHPRYFEIVWAAHRTGLYYTTISRHLKGAEMLYILQDCGARVVFCSPSLMDGELLAQVSSVADVVSLDGPMEGASEYEAALAEQPLNTVLPVTLQGTDFCYSSGTTGRPKGIKRPLAQANRHFNADPDSRTRWKTFDAGTIFLSTAPFYHTAPIRWNMAVMEKGGSCVMLERFDERLALSAIERYHVTHSQWVPTMFVRLLRLTTDERHRYDLSSLRFAIHAAAPCPVGVKEQMIAWWGPILYEFYSGTELVGRTSLDSHEWLLHKGSVGRPEFGAVHIVGVDGYELPSGKEGVVYFSGGPVFEYHNDPEKTRQAYNKQGWGTYGDIGYVDKDGYLYLTDRLANVIISGGVNIYPQEAEGVLAVHPKVKDVAVVGVPNEEYGEEVKAVVELWEASDGTAKLADELIASCRKVLSALKCPRSVDFVSKLPRTESGKLLKRQVKASYWTSGSAAKI